MSEKDFLATPSTEEKDIKDTVVREALLNNDVNEPDIKDALSEPEEIPAADEAAAPESYVSDTSSNDESFLADDVKQPRKTEDPVYMVRQFNMGREDELADKDKFTRKDTNKKSKKSNGKKGRKLRTYQQRQDMLGYAFMSPWIIGFIVFTFIPFIATIYLSFCNVKKGGLGYEIEFSGLNNYITAFVKNSQFTPSLVEYVRVIVPYTFIVVVLSFIIAYLLNKINVGKALLRTMYFLPVIIMSGPVMDKITAVDENATKAAEMAGNAVASDYSNIFIMQIIESYSPQLSTALGSIFDQLSLILWFTGIPIVLFINALQKINVSIYEAAKIDSANAWQIMWKITIPMLRSIGLIVTIFTVIQLGMYGAINPLYTLINDATGDTASGLGYAAAYSWIYSILVLVLVGVIFLLFREKKGKRGA